jgi:hypothetical protein
MRLNDSGGNTLTDYPEEESFNSGFLGLGRAKPHFCHALADYANQTQEATLPSSQFFSRAEQFPD